MPLAACINYCNFGQSTDFEETSYERYAFGGHSIEVIFNFLYSVITTWRTREVVRPELH